MTAFRPGQSPPPVSTPMRMPRSLVPTEARVTAMTFSIVGRDGDAFGVAVASKFLAVGSALPAARAGVGAIATQASANLSYRPDGLAQLADGVSSQETAQRLTAADEGQAPRQLGIV